MKNKLDELFKKKTEGYQKEPSAEAWNKIHRNLHPRSKVPVWQIAASILLIAGVTAVIYLQMNHEGNQPPVIAGTDPVDSAKTEIVPAPQENNLALGTENAEKQEMETDTANNQSVKPALPKPIKTPDIQVAENNQKTATEHKEQIQPEIQETLDSKDALAYAEEIPVNPIKEAEEENSIAKSTQKRPTVTIVYQKSDTASAAVAQNKEKESKEGLGKIFNLAKDLKNGDLNLSEIRDVKDELLALDISIRRNNTKTRD